MSMGGEAETEAEAEAETEAMAETKAKFPFAVDTARRVNVLRAFGGRWATQVARYGHLWRMMCKNAI